MDIFSPSEPVFYYECSSGEVRLVYFMPPEVLKRLLGEKRISPEALEDYPDGVDLGCTESDFKEFYDHYGYRPSRYEPAALRRAFFAIFSTTHDWKQFQGSGFISAAVLDEHVASADAALRDKNVSLEDIRPSPDDPPDRRRKLMAQRADQQFRINEILEEMQVEGVVSNRPIHLQEFSEIPTKESETDMEVFFRLHQKGKGKG